MFKVCEIQLFRDFLDIHGNNNYYLLCLACVYNFVSVNIKQTSIINIVHNIL